MKDILYKTEKVYYDTLFHQMYIVTTLLCRESGTAVRYRYIKIEANFGGGVSEDMLERSNSSYYEENCVYIGEL